MVRGISYMKVFLFWLYIDLNPSEIAECIGFDSFNQLKIPTGVYSNRDLDISVYP